ncbi:MAG: hypothetical protein KGM98_08680 [Bacteroidota bacterium]|nr:hypothetical protein [Bacteroidota bacterium]
MKTIKKILKEENTLSLAGNLVIALFGIAGFSLMARSFSASIFGQWVLLISAGSLVEMIRFGITSTGLVRYLSGADGDQRKHLIGSNALIGLMATLVVAALLFAFRSFFPAAIARSGYGLFFKWYPLIALVNLPWNNATVVLQADRSFGKILILKAVNSGGIFLSITASFFLLHWSVDQLALMLVVTNSVTSLISLSKGWDGIHLLGKAHRTSNAQLLHFGKYTTLTMVGTNLLRSADTFIISLSPLGSAAVALYSIPMKLTELQQIPLRSFTATAFPKMSRASIQGKMEEVKHFFYTYAGAITLLFLLVSCGTFLFADTFVVLLGGKKYLGTDPVTGFNAASIVRVFSIYGLLLPIDRMTGIALDSINRPSVNARKVVFMLSANIIGDVIAVYVFHSLVLVAVASILFTLVGIYVGMRFLQKDLGLKYEPIFRGGLQFYKSYASRGRMHSISLQTKGMAKP